jgi:hypothetical protein
MYSVMQGAMPQDRTEYQEGISSTDLIEAFGAEENSPPALSQSRWPDGFCCLSCSPEHFGDINYSGWKASHGKGFRHQTFVTVGIIFSCIILALAIWNQKVV